MSVPALIEFAGGDINFESYCRTAARVVRNRWRGISEDELTQMIAVEALEGAPTLVKNLQIAVDPDVYLMGALVREGSRAASEATYADAVSGVSATSTENVDWYEEARFGTPAGLYSTNGVRSALTALDWPCQDDELVRLVSDSLPHLSEGDRDAIVDRYSDGVRPKHTITLTRAVDRLTRLVNA